MVSLCFRASVTTNSPATGTTPDRRQDREEGMIIYNTLFASKHDRMRKCDSIASLGVDVAPARFRKCQVCCWSPAAYIQAGAKWMNERTLRQSYVCLSMATGFCPPHSSTNSCMTCFLWLCEAELAMLTREVKLAKSESKKGRSGPKI